LATFELGAVRRDPSGGGEGPSEERLSITKRDFGPSAGRGAKKRPKDNRSREKTDFRLGIKKGHEYPAAKKARKPGQAEKLMCGHLEHLKQALIYGNWKKKQVVHADASSR